MRSDGSGFRFQSSSEVRGFRSVRGGPQVPCLERSRSRSNLKPTSSHQRRIQNTRPFYRPVRHINTRINLCIWTVLDSVCSRSVLCPMPMGSVSSLPVSECLTREEENNELIRKLAVHKGKFHAVIARPHQYDQECRYLWVKVADRRRVFENYFRAIRSFCRGVMGDHGVWSGGDGSFVRKWIVMVRRIRLIYAEFKNDRFRRVNSCTYSEFQQLILLVVYLPRRRR